MSHRYTLARVCLGMLTLLAALTVIGCLPGCTLFEPTIDSPVSGKPVTATQLQRELTTAETKARADAQAAAEEAASKIRKAQSAARLAAIDLTQRQAATAAELAAKAAQVEVDTGVAIDEATAIAAAASKALTARLAVLDQQAEDAQKELQKKLDNWTSLAGIVAKIPGVQQVAGAAGIDIGGIVGLLGLGGTVAGFRVASNAKSAKSAAQIETEKAKDTSYEDGFTDGQKMADEKHAAINAAREQAQLAFHQLYSQPPARPTIPVIGTLGASAAMVASAAGATGTTVTT